MYVWFIGAALLGLATAVLFGFIRPSHVHGEKNSCPLTVRQENAAVKAFKRLAPLFQEPRCLNCHGGVNPFSQTGGHGGGYIDIRKETQDFLKLSDFQNSLTIGSDPQGTIAARTIQGLKTIAESSSDISDNDLIKQQAFDPMRAACKECHIFSWIIPMRHNYFVGRSAKDMCLHIKTSSLTNTPAAFLRHMQNDELILEGFKGRRGLLEPVTPEPPRMSFDAVKRFANDWIEAMGGKFHKPPDCGCVVHGDYILEFRSVIVSTNPNGDPARSEASSTIRLDAPQEDQPGAESLYRGQGNITYNTGPLPNWNACTPLVRGQGAVPLRVYQAFIQLEEQPKIELLYGILGMSQETSTGMAFILNGKCVPNPPEFYPFWSSMYFSGRGEAGTTPEQMFLVKDWTYVGRDGVIATKTLRSSCGGMCDQEIATFVIREGDSSEASPTR